VAPATINKEIQTLKNVVKKAVEWGKIQTNLISEFKPLKTPPGRVRYLELEQVPKLMKACPDWLKPIVMISMNTGLRRGEVVSLQRKNIDKTNRLITLENTKNNERKTIPMNDTVFQVVRTLPTRLDTPYLFVEKNGKLINAAKVSTAFSRARKKAGIEDFRLHDLRHHFASYLTMAGQNQRTVQELLGHKTPAMTARYSHLSPEHLRAAVDTLDRLESAAVLK
jgi:integrase